MVNPAKASQQFVRWNTCKNWLRCLTILTLVVTTCNVASAGSTFAVIGDYGRDSLEESNVATMIKTWNVDVLLTTGDNNYPNGVAGTIDKNIGKHFHEFIGAYSGAYGQGAGDGPLENRFFPTLGNHDWRAPSAQPYLDYFVLPGAGYENSSGNERFYDFSIGNIQFFAFDSDPNEPDGIGVGSNQATWLRESLEKSTADWQVVFSHESPFSSSRVHGNNPVMQLPFKEWGADVVLSGHDHLYERLIVDGLPYFVVGNSGANLYEFGEPICGSRYRYNESHGALRVTISGRSAVIEMMSVDDGANGANGGRPIDRFELSLDELLQEVPGDGNRDGRVDLTDLNAVRNFFGAAATGDVDRDCIIGLDDMNLIRNNFGGVGIGDVSGDGQVDLEDLNGIRNGLGTLIAADVNRDGIVDLTDFNLVRNNFGASANSAIPEPNSLYLTISAVVGLVVRLQALRQYHCR